MDKLYKVYAEGNLRAETFSRRKADEVEQEYTEDGWRTHIDIQRGFEFSGEPIEVDSEHLKEMKEYISGFRDYLREIPLEGNEKPMTQLLTRIDTMRNIIEKYIQ